MALFHRPVVQESIVREDALSILRHLALCLLLLACGPALGQPTAEQIKFFEAQIRPLLANECYGCHSTKAKITFGGLHLDSGASFAQGGQSGGLVVPGKPEESLLLKVVGYGSALKMPPSGKLKPEQLGALTEWVRMGAPWPDENNSIPGASALGKQHVDSGKLKHWAWQPLAKVVPPTPKATAWAAGDIDRFILAKLEENGLTPSPDADRRVLLRRVYFDLIGLPPKPAEVDAFVSDRNPNALETVVDRLLASVHFGERWGRHWLDLTYFADNLEIGRKIPAKEAWRYRDYVIDSFNQDKPYTKFIMEQIAGDLLSAETDALRREQVIATGFLALGPWSLADADKEQTLMDVVDMQVDLAGKTFLGLTLGCARCHDHKFDPIPARDYYALAGIFRSTQTLDTHRDAGHFSDVTRTLLPETPEELRQRAVQTESHLHSLAELKREHRALTEEKEQLTRDEQPAQEIDKRLAKAAKRIAWLEYTRPEPPAARAVRDTDAPANARINIRGNPHMLGEEVPRSFVQLAMWGSAPRLAFRVSGRRELAEWIADKRNPLTARVVVNRVWQHLFGAGLVRSVDNFGLRGERPTHPQLLDHLAVRFMEQGWSIKNSLREMILSRTYGQSSAHNARAFQVDPENLLHWRMSRRRLEGEIIRDAVLAITQTLSDKCGGPSLPLDDPDNLNLGTPAEFRDDAKFPPDLLTRRTVYLPVLRKNQHYSVDILNLFDFPDVSSLNGARSVTTVPTQALYLINSPFFQQHAKLLAARVLEDVAGDEPRVQWLTQHVLGRDARPSDHAEAAAFLRTFAAELAQGGRPAGEATREAWERYCQALIVSNEFLYLL